MSSGSGSSTNTAWKEEQLRTVEERSSEEGGFISAKARGVIEKCAALTGSAD